MYNDRHGFNTGFNDILFGALFIVMVLFVLVLTLIKETNDGDVNLQAAIIIIATWDSNSDNDIDLWVKDPSGNIVFFREPKVGLMHLDRDDIGKSRDTTWINGQFVTYKGNQEVIKIRKAIIGKYIINIHFYRGDIPETITIQAIQIQPLYKILITKTIVKLKALQEKTAFVLTVDKYGKVINIDSKTQIGLIKEKLVGATAVDRF